MPAGLQNDIEINRPTCRRTVPLLIPAPGACSLRYAVKRRSPVCKTRLQRPDGSSQALPMPASISSRARSRRRRKGWSAQGIQPETGGTALSNQRRPLRWCG